MDRGVLTIETDYSGNDCKIEWEGIKEIYAQTSFLITLSDGRRFNGRLESAGNKRVAILTNEGGRLEVNHWEIVNLKEIDDSFVSRLYASAAVGFSFTKAQSLRPKEKDCFLFHLMK